MKINTKKIFKLLSLTALIMVLGLYNKSFAFSDVKEGHWAFNYITDLTQKGVIKGYPDGTYRPDDYVSRAEFASMTARGLGLLDKPITTEYEFADVTKDYWAHPYIELCVNYDLLKGTPGGYFLPEDNVKRIEIIATITNALSIIELTPNQAREYLSIYKDLNEIPEWAIKRTAKAKQLDMIVNLPNDGEYLAPLRPATRAEVAGFLSKMIEHAELHPSKKIATHPKVMEGYVLKDIYIDKNIAYIPSGTIIPLAIMECFTTKIHKRTNKDMQLAKKGEVFSARATKNFVNKDNVLIIPIGTRFEGTIERVSKEKTFIKNGNIVFATNTMIRANTPDTMTEFVSVADVKARRKSINLNKLKMDDFLSKFAYNVFKGQNLSIHKGLVKEFVLIKPVEFDVMTNWIPE